ncbi:hypothetical protein KGF57_004946 [Candida theae]|uniref:Uncharacterized protein n=1 Tax=Candida theae TaxID=1198502 RepID=A0AAD5BAU8_9ASCO|nr:uncharacterized protein KGF57_004946 [Candida theae]KAI5949116.1 hypothetical protein KGF57_004946 [Candida theae]
MFARHISKPLARSIRTYATEVVVPPPRTKKVGAFRGGFIGFLLGVTVTGGASYYYLLDQYNASNTVVAADVIALQASISNLERHVKSLEQKK